MNIAQRFYASLTGLPDFEGADILVAVEQTRQSVLDKRAPHAPRPTPPRPHYWREFKPRLFKGHRP